jgi:hypothetical protein
MARNLSWTDKQKKARELLLQGKTDEEVRTAGLSQATITRVKAAIKTDLKEAKKQHSPGGLKPSPSSPGGGPLGSPVDETKLTTRTLDPINVGGIMIDPADWHVNQYGGLLILGTYEHARNQYKYGGTVGEFLCDCTQIIRKLMGLDMVATDYLKEDNNGQQGTDGEGAALHQEARTGAGGAEPG